MTGKDIFNLINNIKIIIIQNKDEIEKEVLKHEKTTHYLHGKSPKKIIIVPKRIVNIVF